MVVLCTFSLRACGRLCNDVRIKRAFCSQSTGVTWSYLTLVYLQYIVFYLVWQLQFLLNTTIGKSKYTCLIHFELLGCIAPENLSSSCILVLCRSLLLYCS